MRTWKRNARSKDRDREVDQEGSEAYQIRPEAGRPKVLSNHEPRRTPEEAASIFDNVLQNRATKAQTDCVLINASFAIQAREPQKQIEECVSMARVSLESGRAWNTFCKFVSMNS